MLMSKLLSRILLITAVFVSFGITTGFAADGGAKIEVVEEVADFGDVKPKSVHTFIYRFKNTGNEELKISRIQSTCGCSVPQLDKKEYAPNETGEIKVTYTAPRSKSTRPNSSHVANPYAVFRLKKKKSPCPLVCRLLL